MSLLISQEQCVVNGVTNMVKCVINSSKSSYLYIYIIKYIYIYIFIYCYELLILANEVVCNVSYGDRQRKWNGNGQLSSWNRLHT